MTDRANGTPRHLWIVGGLSLFWNCIGAADYTMTQTRNSAWLQGVTPAQLAYLESFPAWAVSAWALGVWGALAGSVLLLLRSRLAVTAFAISLAGLIANLAWRFALSGMDEAQIFGSNPYPLAGVIFVIAAALFVYAQRLKAAGVLR